MTVTLAQASIIVDTALKKARDNNLAPLTVAVLDSGLENADGFVDYAPQLRFYAERAAERGQSVVHMAAWPQRRDGSGQFIASCDPLWAGALRRLGADTAAAPGCVVIRMEDAPQVSPIGEREIATVRQARGSVRR